MIIIITIVGIMKVESRIITRMTLAKGNKECADKYKRNSFFTYAY